MFADDCVLHQVHSMNRAGRRELKMLMPFPQPAVISQAFVSQCKVSLRFFDIHLSKNMDHIPVIFQHNYQLQAFVFQINLFDFACNTV